MREKRIIVNCAPFANPSVHIFFGMDPQPAVSVSLKQKELYEFISGHMDGVTEIKIKGIKFYTKKIQTELREYLITKNSYNSASIELI